MFEPYPITNIPVEAYLYACCFGLVHAAIAGVGLVLGAPLLYRSWRRYLTFARAFIVLSICFLLTSALVNGIWSSAIWGRVYFSADYVADFNPFYPISQAWIEVPFGAVKGKILPGFTIAHVRIAWFLFAFASWASAFFLYSRVRRLWIREKKDIERCDGGVPLDAARCASPYVRCLRLASAVLALALVTSHAADIPKKGRSGWRSEQMFSIVTWLKVLNSQLVAPEPLFSAVPPRGRYAVCIGVNDYSSADIPDLQYAANDCMDLAELFSGDKFGFPRSNVHCLQNHAATRSAILRLLGQLSDSAPSESVLVLTYSGHGFLQSKPSVADPFEEYLLPWDAELRRRQTLLSDTDLLRQLDRSRFRYIYVFLDVCFGAAPTNSSLRSRSLPNRIAGARSPALFADVLKGMQVRPTGSGGASSAGETESPMQGSPPRIVVVTAAAANQSAVELPELEHGLFSYYLLAALHEASPRIGLSSVTEAIASSIRGLGFAQAPIIEDSNGNSRYLTGMTVKE